MEGIKKEDRAEGQAKKIKENRSEKKEEILRG